MRSIRQSHYLASGHLLAAIANTRCVATHGLLAVRNGLGRIACGRCWEHVIRDDERAALGHDLPRTADVEAVRAPWSPYLGHRHPLAVVAQSRCVRQHGERISRDGYDHVACGSCWERAIRDDERVVVEHDLPRELTPDPNFIDEIAVDLAVAGNPVRLTSAERREVIRRLRASGIEQTVIQRRLRISGATDRVQVNSDFPSGTEAVA